MNHASHSLEALALVIVAGTAQAAPSDQGTGMTLGAVLALLGVAALLLIVRNLRTLRYPHFPAYRSPNASARRCGNAVETPPHRRRPH